MRDQDPIAAAWPLDRRSRRLLRDLAQLGLVQRERASARERLEAELGGGDASALWRPQAAGSSDAPADGLGPAGRHESHAAARRLPG